MVECDLAKVDVVGSNPIRRSKFYQGLTVVKFDPEKAAVRLQADEGPYHSRSVN